MQIVAATLSLVALGGSESYVVTVADQLQRLGHDVWLYGLELGASSDAAQRLGLRVVGDEAQLPSDPDVLLVQDAVVACELAARYRSVPQVFVAHSDVFDLQLPPQLPDLVAAVVVLYDRVERRIRALAQPVAEIVRLTQPIDVERFKPVRALPPRPRVAMTLSNYVHGARLDVLRRACERAGIELRHVGWHGEGQRAADLVLNDADVVFGKARVTVEAMACGRAAYVFDHNGGDGWVTAGSYARLAADNFGGQGGSGPIDEDRLAEDLALYEPAMGIVNRDLAVLHHAATKHAAAIAELLGRVAQAPRAAAVDAPLRELARLVRVFHRADVQAYSLRVAYEALAARCARAEEEAADLRREGARVRAELVTALAGSEALAATLAEREAALDAERAPARQHAPEAQQPSQEAQQPSQEAQQQDALEPQQFAQEAQRHAQEAARLARLLQEVTASRRWRVLQAVLAPADRLRRAARRRP